MKVIQKLKKSYGAFINKIIRTPIKEKHIEIKQTDETIYQQKRVKQEVNRVIFHQYCLPAIIISIFTIYSIYFYLHQFIVSLGVFK
jgi:hypothetical protein